MSEPEDEPVLTPDEIEARDFPNRADPEHWDALSAVIVKLCEDDASPDRMINCLRLNWKVLIDAPATIRSAKQTELTELQNEAQRRVDDQPAIDARITKLQEELRA